MEHLPNYSDIKELVAFSNENRNTSFRLAELANSIWQMEDSWGFYDLNKNDFNMAISRGLINIAEGNSIEFKDRLSFEYFYCISLLKSSGIQENRSLKELANLIWHKIYREKSTKSGIKFSTDFSVISNILMFNFFSRNIFAAYFKDTESDLDEINWRAEKVIPYLNIDADKLFLVAKEAQKTKVSSMPGLANGIVELIKLKSEIGTKLLQKVDEDPDANIKSLLPAIISGLTLTLGATFTLPIIIKKLESPHDYDVTNGLFILQRFELDDACWTLFGETIIQRLELIEKGHIEEYKLLLPEVYIRHFKLIPLAIDYLLEYSRSENTKFQIAMSNVLWFHAGEVIKEPWFEDLLLNGANWNYSDLGLGKQMAFCLLNIVQNNTSLSLKFLNAWIENGSNRLAQIKIFEHEISKLFGDEPELMAEWLTQSFLSSNNRFHRAMHFVVSNLWVDGFRHLSLSKKVLDTCSFWEVKYILLKIMANIHGKESLESLVFSILKKEPEDDPFWALVANAFMEYICYNYGGAYTYLKEREADASELEKYVIKTVIENSDRYYSHVRKIGDINELKWQSKSGVNFAKLNMKRMSKEMQRNMDNSEGFSIRSLFKNVSLKGGRRFFSKYEGAYTEPATLQDMGSSFELPKGEMIDPVRERLKMIGWNNYKLES